MEYSRGWAAAPSQLKIARVEDKMTDQVLQRISRLLVSEKRGGVTVTDNLPGDHEVT